MSTTRKIKKFYLKNKQVDETNFYDFVQMFSDRNFLVDTETAVKWQAKVTNSPVYYFYFSYIGDNNENKTVKHSDDIKYYFGSRVRQLSPNELKMKDVLLDMLVSYAKTGRPEIVDVKWDPTTHDKLTYLNISSFEPREMESRTTADLTPREFWKSLGFSENENLVSDKIEL
jgi:carboxylesterase type B